MTWQKIETAPKDGTWLLLCGGGFDCGWDGETQPPAVSAQWANPYSGDAGWQSAWYDGGYYGEYENPTHWMPLPEPPNAA